MTSKCHQDSLLLVLSNRAVLSRNRIGLTIMARLVIAITEMAFNLLLPIREASLPFVLISILAKFPSMILMPLSLQLAFTTHLKLSLLLLLTCFVSSLFSCKKSFFQQRNLHQVRPFLNQNEQLCVFQIGSGLDGILSTIVSGKTSKSKIYPCWMISVLLTISEITIPTALVYISEVATRSEFLKSKLPHKSHSLISEYSRSAYNVAILAGISMIVTTWFFLSLIRDLVS